MICMETFKNSFAMEIFIINIIQLNKIVYFSSKSRLRCYVFEEFTKFLSNTKESNLKTVFWAWDRQNIFMKI